MSRHLVLGAALLLLGRGCSRSQDEHAPAPSAPPPLPSPGASTAVSAPPSLVAAGTPLPTPEDAEEDSGRRITEQNLESELDRLEREIQAE